MGASAANATEAERAGLLPKPHLIKGPSDEDLISDLVQALDGANLFDLALDGVRERTEAHPELAQERQRFQGIWLALLDRPATPRPVSAAT